MLSKIRQTIRQYHMLNKGEYVLVALSGGGDSVCLLHVLKALQKEWGLTLCAAHVNHLLRGEAAQADEAFCTSLCHSLGIPLYVKRQDAAAFAREQGISVEMAGRRIRYHFFEELKKAHHIQKIATAHSLSDQAETVLLRMLRGSGTDGISGIAPMREDGVIRPLIQCSKEEILQYLSENRLAYCTDETNADLSYQRNRIRHQLLPMLEASYPGAASRLSRMAEHARRDGTYLKKLANEAFLKYATKQQDMVFLALPMFSLEDEAVVFRVLRQSLQLLTDIPLETQHVQGVYRLIEKGENGKKQDVVGGVSAVLEYGKLCLCRDHFVPPFSYSILPGESIFINETGMQIRTVLYQAEQAWPKDTLAIGLKSKNVSLVIRNRRDGDHFQPLGMAGTKKMKNFFIDYKVPRRLRECVPILEIDGEIACIVGMAVSENFKITQNSQYILTIENIEKRGA